MDAADASTRDRLARWVAERVFGLDPNDIGDERLLPDGSRWVDAAALVAVARHVGALCV